jgi:mevalonate kinase
MTDTITARSSGRICLLGDNADLIEKPAIAAAISAYMTIELTKRMDDLVVLTAKDIGFQEEFRLGDRLTFESPLRFVEAVYQRLKDRVDSGFDAVIHSEIPISAGLSSSAALCIASIRVLSRAYSIPFTPGEIAELAFQIESGDLKVECGRMDQYAIAFGGITYIHTGVDAGVEKLPGDSLPVVVADTLEQHDTRELQIWLRRRIESKEKLLLDSLGRVVDIVEGGREALLKGDLDTLGMLMNNQQAEEKLMGTSTGRIENFCAAARDAGALGAKQMGAGGGGCMIALCPSEGLEIVKSAFVSLGAPAWVFRIVED